jgi:hypothetical protein
MCEPHEDLGRDAFVEACVAMAKEEGFAFDAAEFADLLEIAGVEFGDPTYDWCPAAAADWLHEFCVIS